MYYCYDCKQLFEKPEITTYSYPTEVEEELSCPCGSTEIAIRDETWTKCDGCNGYFPHEEIKDGLCSRCEDSASMKTIEKICDRLSVPGTPKRNAMRAIIDEIKTTNGGK